MSEQHPLDGINFNTPPTRAGAGGTSWRAASVAGRSAPKRRRQVFDAYAEAGPRGLTDEKCADLLGLPVQCVGPRRLELERAGLLKLSGEKRPTRTGCPLGCSCWRATPRKGVRRERYA